jgi:beta-ketoacyl-acyl-carrier-protein synthase II
MRRIAVTGLGAVTPLGNDVASTWQGLMAGRSGIDFVSCLPTFPGAIGGEVRDFRTQDYVPSKHVNHMDRYSQFAAVAALAAIKDAGLDRDMPFGAETGIVFSSSVGGYGVLGAQLDLVKRRGPRNVSPFTLSRVLPDSASGQIAILTGATGPNMAVTSASASGASAIGEAAEIIRRGDAEVMIAGAAEAPLTPILYAGFSAMRALASSGHEPAAACRPFDMGRTGFVVAEGAGAVVLESMEHARERGATVYAELAGYGSANDAFDMVASEPSGRGPVLSMRMALSKAGLPLETIGYVNAHGTASKMNDRIETAALKQVFGEHARRLAVSSTKSMMGHLMGAAGAVEAVISVLALTHESLPPTINYEQPDPDCDLDYVPNVARAAPGLQAVLSHSIGLGGHNATLVFTRAADAATPTDGVAPTS